MNDGAFEYIVPDELEAGMYANVLAVWHTRHEFTLDFCTALPRDPDEPDVARSRLVGRVKLPVTIMFHVIRELNTAMTRYEDRFGEIPQPREDV